jgi:hypothetical protein
LAVVADFTRECFALVAHTSLSGRRLKRDIDAVMPIRKPRTIVSDSGTEITSRSPPTAALNRVRFKRHFGGADEFLD